MIGRAVAAARAAAVVVAVVAVVAVVTVVTLRPAIASADPAKDRAALAEFEAAYRATAALSGPARINQACADAAKLSAAGSAFSSETPPADAPVDEVIWSRVAGWLAGALDDLVKVCKAPDRKLPMLGTEVKTVDQVVKALDDDVQQVLNSARPRTLPPAMKAAQAAIAAMLASMRAICTEQPKLMKALAKLARPPAGVPAAAWKEPYQTVKNIAADLKPGACGRHRGADEQIGSALSELHDDFYALVLLVPPR
ncbi:MAG TPA: hypothetical protein VFT22_42575 [Kofleriaceae bacterium]|nr:hypothetical protein [Kofleriaceae bacterium]